MPENTDIPGSPGDLAYTYEQLTTYEGADTLVREAVENGIASALPVDLGDAGLAFVVPEGYNLQTVDVRLFEHNPRPAPFIMAKRSFVGTKSLNEYVDRYQTEDSLAYITDIYGKGVSLLTSDTQIATVILDDHPAEHGANPGRREHVAQLVLRPTAAARRWGAALAATSISQEQFLDLVVDGLAEIASPDGSVLRDLISDLHAIRSTEVKSVVRTGGEGSISLAENVKLHAGTGDTVTFPESMTIVLSPFAARADAVPLELRIKPKVQGNEVVFGLSCGQLDDRLAEVIGEVAGDITAGTGLTVHWQP